eukprot:g16216.t1
MFVDRPPPSLDLILWLWDRLALSITLLMLFGMQVALIGGFTRLALHLQVCLVLLPICQAMRLQIVLEYDSAAVDGPQHLMDAQSRVARSVR